MRDPDYVTLYKVIAPKRWRDYLYLGRLLGLLALLVFMTFACQAKICMAKHPDKDWAECVKEPW